MDTVKELNEMVEKRAIAGQKAAAEHDWLTAYGEYLHLKQVTACGYYLYEDANREYYCLEYALLVMDAGNTENYGRDYTAGELAAMITQTYIEVLATETTDTTTTLKAAYLDSLEEAATTVFEMIDSDGRMEHLHDDLREMRAATMQENE